MTPSDFILKWEQQLQDVTSQWKYASKKGWSEAELIEGARMQGIGLMLEDFYDTFKIIPRFLREFPEQVAKYEKEGWVVPQPSEEVPS